MNAAHRNWTDTSTVFLVLAFVLGLCGIGGIFSPENGRLVGVFVLLCAAVCWTRHVSAERHIRETLDIERLNQEMEASRTSAPARPQL